jgi:hypothetical protein
MRLIVTLMRDKNVDRHHFLQPAELNANRNEMLPAACAGRIDVYGRDVNLPSMCVVRRIVARTVRQF